MSQLSRRRFFKIITATTGVALINQGCSTKLDSAINKKVLRAKNAKQTRVVVVGGGMGGLTVAENIKQNDPDNKIEVIVLERNAKYFTCPMSNTLLER